MQAGRTALHGRLLPDERGSMRPTSSVKQEPAQEAAQAQQPQYLLADDKQPARRRSR